LFFDLEDHPQRVVFQFFAERRAMGRGAPNFAPAPAPPILAKQHPYAMGSEIFPKISQKIFAKPLAKSGEVCYTEYS